MTEQDSYEVSFRGYAHVSIEAESEDAAREKAKDELRGFDWEVSNTTVNGPFDF